MAYAEETTVPFDKSIAQIVRLIKDSNADSVAQFEGANDFAVQFMLAERLIRFRLPLPTLDDMPLYTAQRHRYTEAQRRNKLEQAKKSKARALLLVIKAKLESVESGIETTEQAFLANVVMADGFTVYERIAQPIALEYQTGKPSASAGLLPPPADRS